MNIVLLLIPLMLFLVVIGVILFSWAVKNGQYDDLDGPAHRILFDDDKDMIPDEARTDKPKAGSKASSAPASEPDASRDEQG
ncbi:MAG TPA: cbb3-type cytochrome oxidase assembly protein CcoS [Marinobacter sp.]|nr:cbb3-type cytochrome oxidase assembly protein CcoS [Marinobacter sp.]